MRLKGRSQANGRSEQNHLEQRELSGHHGGRGAADAPLQAARRPLGNGARDHRRVLFPLGSGDGYGVSRSDRTPADLKELSLDELVALSDELRQYIIEIVSLRGGHLASSLGAVEIALALHYVFRFAAGQDSLGCRASELSHKILTGRRSRSRICGRAGTERIPEPGGERARRVRASATRAPRFRRRSASPFRATCSVGTISLSPSSATRDIGGLAFEGINQAGHLKKNRFIIVLNDNEMSISKNVGALART